MTQTISIGLKGPEKKVVPIVEADMVQTSVWDGDKLVDEEFAVKEGSMPYQYPDNVPDYIKNQPEGLQKLFIEVFNSAVKDGKSEDEARQAGWGAVKNKYEKVGEEWKLLASEQTLRYVAALPATIGSGRTSQVQVFRTGVFRHPLYGKFTITDDDLSRMEANFRERRPKSPTEIVVDYEHMSTAPLTKAPAAGWVKNLKHTAGELVATVEWTKAAADHITAKEYRFISPEWHMHYRDKESGNDIGPCLLSMALTNRPFIEGMQPVILSERMEDANSKVLVLSERMIANYNPDGAAMMAAEWDTQYINDLPDSCFAYVAPGGEKDEGGKTVPRSLRSLPYRKADGAVDLPHLRNALARLEQTDLSPEAKAKAKATLEEAAAKAGVGEAGQDEEKKAKEANLIDETKVRELLGIGPEDDLLAALKALVDKTKESDAKVEEAVTAKEKAEATLLAKDVDADVAKAIGDRLILPKQETWAKSLRAKDPEAFKAYLATATPVGPDLTPPKGKETGGDTIKLSEAEIEAGRKMGLSDDEMLAQKKRDAGAQA